MTPERVRQIQRHLNTLGYGPLRIDGVYGPATAAAYDRYLATVPGDTETPPPAKPWYLSRAILGALATIAAGAAGVAGYAIDASNLTEILVQAIALFGGIMALWGSVQRKAPIDPTLVAPGVRLPISGLRSQSVPSRPDTERRDPRGHFHD